MSVLRITAKPIVWNHDGVGQWSESVYGFRISCEIEHEYTAYYGEGDESKHPTKEKAQKWCQNTINDWVAKVAVVTITND